MGIEDHLIQWNAAKKGFDEGGVFNCEIIMIGKEIAQKYIELGDTNNAKLVIDDAVFIGKEIAKKYIISGHLDSAYEVLGDIIYLSRLK